MTVLQVMRTNFSSAVTRSSRPFLRALGGDRDVLRTYDAQTHVLIDAIAATAINAQKSKLNHFTRKIVEVIAADSRRTGETTPRTIEQPSPASTPPPKRISGAKPSSDTGGRK